MVAAAKKPEQIAAEAADPRAALKARLHDLTMSQKRFAKGQEWMREAIESALDKKLDKELADLPVSDCETVLKVLDLAK